MKQGHISGQRGMTLIELMVAMTIGLFMMLILSTAYFNGAQLFQTQNQLAEIQDNGRAAMELLAKEVRMAGYLGCVNESSLATPPFAAIQGYDDLTAYGSALNGAFSDAKGPVLVIRHGAYNSIPVTSATSASITAGPDVFAWKGTTPTLLISDCVAATSFTAGAVTGSNESLTVAPAAGTTIAGAFGSTARLRPVETSTFFLATPTGHSQPSLYQRYSNGYVNVDLRVADNVADWRLGYATGDEDSKVNATNQLASSITATDWAKVKALRVDLLLMGSRPVLSAPASYWFNFEAKTPTDTDKHMHKEMASTLALRNRITDISP
jgi:type IV pilus assembly protein PilW